MPLTPPHPPLCSPSLRSESLEGITVRDSTGTSRGSPPSTNIMCSRAAPFRRICWESFCDKEQSSLARPPCTGTPGAAGLGDGPWDGGRGTQVSTTLHPARSLTVRASPGGQGGEVGGRARPHLLEEHHLQPVGEVQALVVRAERHGEVLRGARVHDALHRDHAEHALAVVVLRACGRGEAVPAPSPAARSSPAQRPAPKPPRLPVGPHAQLLWPFLHRPPPSLPYPAVLRPLPLLQSPPTPRLTHDFRPLGGRGEELWQLLLVLAPGAGEAVQPHGELDGQRGVVLQLRAPSERQPLASAPCPPRLAGRLQRSRRQCPGCPRPLPGWRTQPELPSLQRQLVGASVFQNNP